jgi:hypothetical protein
MISADYWRKSSESEFKQPFIHRTTRADNNQRWTNKQVTPAHVISASMLLFPPHHQAWPRECQPICALLHSADNCRPRDSVDEWVWRNLGWCTLVLMCNKKTIMTDWQTAYALPVQLTCSCSICMSSWPAFSTRYLTTSKRPAHEAAKRHDLWDCNNKTGFIYCSQSVITDCTVCLTKCKCQTIYTADPCM